jgi:hypothetical protein
MSIERAKNVHFIGQCQFEPHSGLAMTAGPNREGEPKCRELCKGDTARDFTCNRIIHPVYHPACEVVQCGVGLAGALHCRSRSH